MNDKVIETFVKAKKNRLLPLYILCIVLGLVIVSAVIYHFYRLIGFYLCLILWGFGFYCIYWLVLYNRLEYEFSLTGSEFTVSEIRNQAKRKQKLVFAMKDVENFRKVNPKANPSEIENQGDTVLHCFGEEDEEIYTFTVPTEGGKVYRIYLPYNDRIFGEMALHSFEVRRVLGRF